MEVLDEKFATNLEAKKILEARRKEKELIYEQKITYDFLEKIVTINEKDVEKIMNSLSDIPVLKPKHLVLICNLLPNTEEEVQLIFAKESLALKKDEIKKIVDVVRTIKPVK